MIPIQAPPLDYETLVNLSRAALDNALALVEEAGILRGAGAFPRSMVLIILAGEELAKHVLAAEALLHNQDEEPYWKSFWETFRNHNPKLTGLISVASDDAEGLERQVVVALAGEFAKILNKDKQAALYVDVLFEGEHPRVQSPEDTVDEGRANHMVDRYGGLIRKWAQMIEGRGGLESVMDELLAKRKET